jgi:hypothetical protein
MSSAEKRSFPLFTEDQSADIVNSRIVPDVDPRTRQIAETVVRHLHAAVKDIEPTHEEWLAAIRFLTDTRRDFRSPCVAWFRGESLFCQHLHTVNPINQRDNL